MKSITFILSLAALLILAGCQIAKAPENGAGEEGEGAPPEVVTEGTTAPIVEEGDSSEATAIEDAGETPVEEKPGYQSPNYDAKVDGDADNVPTYPKEND